MLEVKGLEAGYGRRTVLRGLDLAVAAGEVVCVLGPNGAGKTTLLRALSGLVPIRGGSASFQGESITRLPAHEISRRGLVHVQEGKQVFPSLTVGESLLVARYVRRRGEESLEPIFDIFPRLRERYGQRTSTLSGGERQMLAIAMGLLMEPKLLLLDEPSHGLAPKLIDEVFERIQAICKRYHVAILLVEQRLHEALAIADRGYVLANGCFVLEGSTRELRENRQVRHAYLGHRGS